MNSYATFAQFYDETMGDMSTKVNFLHQLIKEYAPEAHTILEFACGTGAILSGLTPQYTVAGFDLSPEMAAIAKQKLPESDIRVGDMASMEFGKMFDVVLCVFDSINHLPDWHAWQATFANARKHLNLGGIFIVDCNTSERLEWLSAQPTTKRNLETGSLTMDVLKEGDAFTWHVKAYQKDEDGNTILHQDTIREKSFPVEQIQSELAKHFTVRAVVDAKGLSPDNPNWRPFFICVNA